LALTSSSLLLENINCFVGIPSGSPVATAF
jgi:hypothetical protein